MDCQQCQQHLVDLLAGELPGPLVSQVEAELARCPDCRKAHARLQRGLELAAQLPQLEPSSELHARLLALADRDLDSGTAWEGAAARRKDGATRAHGSDPQQEPSPWQRFLAYVGRLAMGRQFAMATVMLLLVAGTLWMVPQDRAPTRVGVTVASPEPTDEPAAGPNRLAPGKPTALTERETVADARLAAKPAHPMPEEREMGPDRGSAPGEHPGGRSAQRAAREGPGGTGLRAGRSATDAPGKGASEKTKATGSPAEVARAPVARSRKTAARPQVAPGTEAPADHADQSRAGASRATSAAATNGSARLARRAERPAGFAKDERKHAPTHTSEAVGPAAGAATADTEARSDPQATPVQDTLTRARGLSVRGDVDGAVALLRQALSSSQVSAAGRARLTRELALTLLESGRCETGLRVFADVPAHARGNPQGVLIRTAARCLRKLGRDADARALEQGS